jgi:hypothetical protein
MSSSRGHETDCNWRQGCNRQNWGHRGQVRAGQYRHSGKVTQVLQLIDKWGNESMIDNGVQLNRIKHQKVLPVLERRVAVQKQG